MSSLEKPNQKPELSDGPAGEAGIFLPDDSLPPELLFTYVGRISPLLRKDGKLPTLFDLKAIGEDFAKVQHYGEDLIPVRQPDGSTKFFIRPEVQDARSDEANTKLLGKLASKSTNGEQPEQNT